MDKVRVGVIGLGNMGLYHAQYMNSVEGAILSAVCDVDPARVDRASKGSSDVAGFSQWQDLVNSGKCDAILIATPHFQHCEISRAAFAKGIHVMTEKPVAVSVHDARRTNDAHAKVPHLKYAIMYQTRTNHLYVKIRELIADGELGELTRITWIDTDWLRTWAYYASSSWRATWTGEGGGCLINQCPHNLDLFQWLIGMMPNRITAIAAIAKKHPIETEDEVSAILEFPNGAIGHFITSTGEAPGTNRLEICGDRGKLVAERGKLTFYRNRKSVKDVLQNSPDPFAHVEAWESDIAYKTNKPEGHKVMMQNFINAILKNEPLIAPGEEGVKGLELGNGMLLAGVTRTPVDLPLDGERYEQFLKEMAARYGGKKTLQVKASVADIASSFTH